MAMKYKPVSEKKNIDQGKNFSLVLYNDDFNTFEHVIRCLVEICGHDPVQAEQCAVITHFKGNCDIKQGGKRMLLAMSRNLKERNLVSEVKSI